MGWIKITKLKTGEISLPKDAVLVPPGMTPPANYKFAYSTHIHEGYESELTPSGGSINREPIDGERHVYVPITGDEE